MFHWHITDSHSFPIKLENAPELAHEGAYKLHQKRLIYRKKDVERVIDYAYRLGIRVIPEIDMVNYIISIIDFSNHLTGNK